MIQRFAQEGQRLVAMALKRGQAGEVVGSNSGRGIVGAKDLLVNGLYFQS